MILDKILLNQIEPIGKSIIYKARLKQAPRNILEMYMFLQTVRDAILKQDFDGIMLGRILYSFVSSLEVRDRKTTSRTFEDIFSGLFGTKATDLKIRSNPQPTKEILKFDQLCKNEDWKISDDMSTNKREKADLIIGNYAISLKTLKGIAFDEKGKKMPSKLLVNDETVPNNETGEINVGSFSYRALLKGILRDADLAKLRDRKGGLGSQSQIRRHVFDKIKELHKQDEFLNRLAIFMQYVYTDDIYIVLKSNYLITWILIPADSFVKAVLLAYKNDEPNFQKIWERWENNNLRMLWHPLVEKMNKYHLNYYRVDMLLGNTVYNKEMVKFEGDIKQYIKHGLDEIIAKSNKTKS